MKPARESGIALIAAIAVLVILAALAAAIVRLGFGQQTTSAQDIQSARAWQAVKAGTEWGLFQAFQPGGVWRTRSACDGNARTLDLSANSGFRVTVRCSATDYREGESAPGAAQQMRVLRIEATACNGSGTCPDNSAAAGLGYVERQREIVAYCPVGAGATDCQP